MWIRSADNESLMNLDNMSMVQVETDGDKAYIKAYDTTACTPIGEYNSKEAAMEELNRMADMLGDDAEEVIYEMEGERNVGDD